MTRLSLFGISAVGPWRAATPVTLRSKIDRGTGQPEHRGSHTSKGKTDYLTLLFLHIFATSSDYRETPLHRNRCPPHLGKPGRELNHITEKPDPFTTIHSTNYKTPTIFASPAHTSSSRLNTTLLSHLNIPYSGSHLRPCQQRKTYRSITTSSSSLPTLHGTQSIHHLVTLPSVSYQHLTYNASTTHNSTCQGSEDGKNARREPRTVCVVCRIMCTHILLIVC